MMVDIPEEIVNERRLGTVVFPKQWLRIHPSLMDEMNDLIFVTKAQQAGDKDEIMVECYCDRFDPLALEDRVPRYSFNFEEWQKSGRFQFTKVPGYGMNVMQSQKMNGGQ